LAAVFDLVRDLNMVLVENALYEDDRPAVLRTMERMNEVLDLWELPNLALDEQIQRLIDERNQARKSRNFALADQIRDKLYEMGYTIEDTKEGVRWKKR
jgi:cysteinyl-tRNA synthetase